MGLKEALSCPCPRVRRLLSMAEAWNKSPAPQVACLPSYQPRQQPSLADQLGEAGVVRVIQQYRSGRTQQELADELQTSASSVKRLIHAHGAQLWRRASGV